MAGAEFAAGPTRFLFSITDRDDRLLAASGTRVRLASYEVAADPEAVVFESDSRFLWAVEDVSCLPVANDSLPSGGRRGTRFWATFPDGRTETIRLHLATASGVAVVHRTEGSRHIVLRLGDAHWVGR